MIHVVKYVSLLLLKKYIFGLIMLMWFVYVNYLSIYIPMNLTDSLLLYLPIWLII